jgi:hypothetical protein
MVRGAKLRSFMSSIIRRRRGVMAGSSAPIWETDGVSLKTEVCGCVPYLRHSSKPGTGAGAAADFAGSV